MEYERGIHNGRFCDGHLISVLEDGEIGRILERLAEIGPEGRAAGLQAVSMFTNGN